MAALDALLGGGLTRGTNTLLIGPSGVGKTTTAVRCMLAALRRGETAAYYLFDEGLATLLARSAALGMDLQPLYRQRPADICADRSGRAVARRVRQRWCGRRSRRTVRPSSLIDSLNAYLQAMPGEQYLLLQMHELLSYLNQQGITTLLVLGQHGLIGDSAHRRRSQLSQRRHPAVPLFRGARRGAHGRLGGQEPDQRARAHHPRVLSSAPRACRSASRCAISRACSAGCRPIRRGHAAECRPARDRPARRPARMTDAVLILAPRGRDAAVIEQVLRRGGVDCVVCADSPSSVRQLASERRRSS